MKWCSTTRALTRGISNTLTACHRDHRRVGEPVTTPGTYDRLMPHRLVRNIDLPQGASLVTVQPARTAPRTAPQRLRRGLVQTLRRGRHVRVPRSLTQPAPQLGVLRLQNPDPGITRRDRLLQRTTDDSNATSRSNSSTTDGTSGIRTSCPATPSRSNQRPTKDLISYAQQSRRP
jgi:hypothetical protein